MEMATGMVRVLREIPVWPWAGGPEAPGGGTHPKGQAYSPEYHWG